LGGGAIADGETQAKNESGNGPLRRILRAVFHVQRVRHLRCGYIFSFGYCFDFKVDLQKLPSHGFRVPKLPTGEGGRFGRQDFFIWTFMAGNCGLFRGSKLAHPCILKPF
jgi:hypothetical protein